jgi:HSP20 family protein
MFFPATRRIVRNHYDLIDRINKEFNRASNFLGDFTNDASPAVNIYSNDEEVLLTAELPGIDLEKLDVSVNGRNVTISGSRAACVEKEGEKALLKERADISFNRTFTLPFTIDSEKVEADYKNGILSVKLPKVEAEKPKSIKVNV